MVQSINTSNVKVESDGRVKFSGLSSGIDAEGAIDGIMKARQARIDSVAKKIDENSAKLKALTDLKTKATALTTSLSTLFGRLSADRAFDTFESKQVTATSVRQSGYSSSASAATDLIGATVTNAAVPGSYDIEVLQIAKPMKVRSGAVDDASVALGYSGTVYIGGTKQTQTFSSSSLSAADWGNTGLSISIVPADGGTTVDFSYTGSSSDDDATNLAALATAFNASTDSTDSGFTASVSDGALIFVATSATDSQATITVAADTSTLKPVISKAGVAPGELTVDTGQSLQDIRDAINNLSRSQKGTGLTASTVRVGPSQSYLVLTANEPGGEINFTWPSDTTSTLETSGIFETTGDSLLQSAQQLRINLDGTEVVRDTNQVSDLIPGVDFSFYKAEEGTTIQFGVERNLSAVTAQIQSMVDAYNDIQSFITTQTAFNAETGEMADGAVLSRSSTLRSLSSMLRSTIAASSYGDATSGAPQSLTDIGITTEGAVGATSAPQLVIDQAKLASALTNSPDAVRRIFSFVGEAETGSTQVIGFDVKTTRPGNGPFVFSYLENSSGTLVPKFLEDGVEQTVERVGNVFRITSGSATGLTLYASADNAVSATTINLKSGLAAQVTASIEDIVNAEQSTLQLEQSALTDSSKTVQERVTAMKDRLERERQSLADKFTRMEAALARMSSLREQIASAFKTNDSNNN